jgi:hypothetical protein
MVVIEGRGLAILCVTIICFFLCVVTVGLRCYVRVKILKFFGWDDILMILATVRGLRSFQVSLPPRLMTRP